MEEFDRRVSHQIPPLHTGVNADATDRCQPWSVLETKEMLKMRGELDRTFSETKHNRLLWVSVADKMKEKGFYRNDEQCKCKWKNLVTRYKGCETIESEAMKQQFPFYSELHAIFSARIQKNWWAEAEGGPIGSKRKANEPFTDDDQNNNKESDEEEDISSAKTKKKIRKVKYKREKFNGGVKKIFKCFVKQQMETEKQWREAFKAREEERRLKEMEWRRHVEALEREKMVTERMWREKDEQRREREEVRAEKRDALITALVDTLIR